MKSVDLHFVGILPDNLSEAPSHGVGGLVRIGEAQDFLRLNLSIAEQQPRYAHGQDFSFSGAWSGNDHHGSIDGINGVFLCRIQLFIAGEEGGFFGI